MSTNLQEIDALKSENFVNGSILYLSYQIKPVVALGMVVNTLFRNQVTSQGMEVQSMM